MSDAIAALRTHERVLVALSGGVDSAVLLALAVEALGRSRVLAATGRSASVTLEEIGDAAKVAAHLGVEHLVVDTNEIARPEYRRNAGDRCFHCRTELFELLSKIALSRGFSAIAYGAIVDDLGDDRPGMHAAKQQGVQAPLLDAHISKTDVRELAHYFDLHIETKPANACLASRVPVGSEVTEERLRQIAEAEAILRKLGFERVRVRHHGEVARIEVDSGEIARFADHRIRAEVAAHVKAAGFRYVALDLMGYGDAGAGRSSERLLVSIAPQADNGQ